MTSRLETGPSPTPEANKKIGQKNPLIPAAPQIEPEKSALAPKEPQALPAEATIFQSPKKPARLWTPTMDKLNLLRKDSGEKISRWADVAGVWLFLSPLKYQIIRKITPEYAEGFDNEFMEKMENPKAVPVIVLNHEGLAF